MIEVFKIFKGGDDIDPLTLFDLYDTITRGHYLKILKKGCRLHCRKFSFSQRIVNMWNSLYEDIIACDLVNSFKSRIDKFLFSQGFV